MNISARDDLTHIAGSSRERRSQEMTSSSSQQRSSFSFQRLSLDSAVSPLLSRPTAPFDRTERKRAHTSALYYSECFLHGIEPVVADTAAEEAQGKYDKWWIKSTAHPHKGEERTTLDTSSGEKRASSQSDAPADKNHVRKWRRTNGETLEEVSTVSANVVSVSTVSAQSEDESTASMRTCNKREQTLSISQISTLTDTTRSQIEVLKARLVGDLKTSGGSVETTEFLGCLEVLEAYYRSKSWDGRGSCKSSPFSLEGNWLTLSKPTYNECNGRSEKGEYMYSLGRLSFDMFKPTQLVCSVQANFNNVRPIDPRNPGRPLHVPRKLMKEIHRGGINLRTYDIVVSFTIEAGQDRKGVRKDPSNGEYVVPKPIRGILTTHGYAVPDPDIPNRLSIWFSGGTLEVQDDSKDLEEWRRVFDATCTPDRYIREYANILAAKLLLGALSPEGMEEDGTMSFALKRPIGGHSSVYCDIVYMDDTLRIMRGHHGSVYVCTRVPEPDLVR